MLNSVVLCSSHLRINGFPLIITSGGGRKGLINDFTMKHRPHTRPQFEAHLHGKISEEDIQKQTQTSSVRMGLDCQTATNPQDKQREKSLFGKPVPQLRRLITGGGNQAFWKYKRKMKSFSQMEQNYNLRAKRLILKVKPAFHFSVHLKKHI